jgi:hypothetical protein
MWWYSQREVGGVIVSRLTEFDGVEVWTVSRMDAWGAASLAPLYPG